MDRGVDVDRDPLTESRAVSTPTSTDPPRVARASGPTDGGSSPERPSNDAGRLSRTVLVGVPLVFLTVFFVWPVARIISVGLRPAGHWRLGAAWHVLTDPSTGRVLWFTFWQAAASTALTVALALPGAWCFARLRFRGRTLLRAAITVPFVLPTVVVSSAFLALIGSGGALGGWLDLSDSIWAILLAHVFFNYAVVVRILGGLWSHLDPALEDAARTLGASRVRAWREVTWPLLRPAVVAAASITFLFTFTSFGVIVILGGVHYATIEVAIKEAALDRLDLSTAAVLSLLQLGAVAVLLLVFSHTGDRRAVGQRLTAAAESARPVQTAGEHLFLAGNLAVMAVLLGTPLAVLVERSLRTPGGHGLDWYRGLSSLPARSSLFVPPVDAIVNSLEFAVAATVIAVVVGGCAAFAVAGAGHGSGRRHARARGLDLLLMLPLGTSAVTVGFGFLVALDRPPLDLRASWWIVPIAQALVAVPFVVRILVPVLRSIDPRLREAAAVLGANPARVRREIDVPIVRRALLVAAGFAFAISLGEFGATLLISRADTPTIPVAIFRLLSRPGAANFGAAMAMSTILMVITGAAIFLIERLRGPGSALF
jgi:thiamine transport system permease protein